jgi:hypothetical protein
MTIEYYDDWDYYFTDEDEFDDEEIEDYYESSDEPELIDINPLFSYEEGIPVNWKTVTIGKTTLTISNEGKIRVGPYYLTTGNREVGSPYRYIEICDNDGEHINHYVHDIVWRAFNTDEVLDGWEVRHLDYTEMDSGQCYINHLDNLNVYQKTISRNIQLHKE